MRWLVVVWMLTGVAMAQPTAKELLQQVSHINASLKTCHCRVHVTVSLSLLPVTLDGDVYYQAPDHVKVTFDDIPPILKTQKGIFSELMPKTRRLDQYHAVVEGEQKVDGVPTWSVRVKPGVANDNVTDGHVWIDEKHLTVPHAVLHYRNGSTVTADGMYQSISNYELPAHLDVNFHLPHLKTQAAADFDGYEVNQTLPSGIFKAGVSLTSTPQNVQGRTWNGPGTWGVLEGQGGTRRLDSHSTVRGAAKGMAERAVEPRSHCRD
jgi:hypothetical protein